MDGFIIIFKTKHQTQQIYETYMNDIIQLHA